MHHHYWSPAGAFAWLVGDCSLKHNEIRTREIQPPLIKTKVRPVFTNTAYHTSFYEIKDLSCNLLGQHDFFSVSVNSFILCDDFVHLPFSFLFLGHKMLYAKEHAVMKDLYEVVKEVKPNVLIGKDSYKMQENCPFYIII